MSFCQASIDAVHGWSTRHGSRPGRRCRGSVRRWSIARGRTTARPPRGDAPAWRWRCRAGRAGHDQRDRERAARSGPAGCVAQPGHHRAYGGRPSLGVERSFDRAGRQRSLVRDAPAVVVEIMKRLVSAHHAGERIDRPMRGGHRLDQRIALVGRPGSRPRGRKPAGDSLRRR